MAHKLLSKFKNQLGALVLAGAILMAFHQNSFAGEPEFVKLKENKPFVFSAGIGYGVSNNPCRNCDDNTSVGGAVISMSMGYKINDKFKIEFGPSFWIEGKDLLNKNVADSERPNNKRTTVTFAGTYSPFQRFPLSFKLGGGAGILNYTPEKSTVKLDESKFTETEIFKGFAGTFGLSYEFQLCPKIKIHPSLNLTYIQLEQPKIEYNSYMDYKKASITTDFRINFNYNF